MRGKYTKEDFEKYAKEVYSIAGLLRKLNLKDKGGNYKTIKKYLQKYEIDTSHWTGQGWNKDQQQKNWKDYKKGHSLRPSLIREKGHKCEKCSLTEWIKKPILLEVHHIDGDNTNNEFENLQLLCPNCHSQTPNWRGRPLKKDKKEKYIKPKNGKCLDCDKPIDIRSKRCYDCNHKKIKEESQGKSRKIKTKKCLDCDSLIDYRSKRCDHCERIRRSSHKPDDKELIDKKNELKTFTALGEYYNISTKTVTQWYKKILMGR